ncbi:MAG: metallopeptidase TldD-related protein, partial [bacterium]
MNAPFSPYLNAITPFLRSVVEELGREYDYVSLLSTDSVGFQMSISRRAKRVSGKNMTTERGTVVRVMKNGLYAEYAFNEIGPDTLAKLHAALSSQTRLLARLNVKPYETAALSDEPLTLFVEKEAAILPEDCDLGALVERLTALSDEGLRTIPGALDCMVGAISTHISKLFLTRNRYLRQSYVYTESNIAAYAPSAEGEMKFFHEGLSGLGGVEILENLPEKLRKAPKEMQDLLHSEKIVPGEYEIITDPGISGLIAHEAFGHGVEMDMFVKHRALGAEYLEKRVGSDLVTMHEGALTDQTVTAFAFDDEGTPAGDVIEID